MLYFCAIFYKIINMEDQDLYVFMRYRNKTIKFKISDPNYEMEQLMNSLKNAVDKEGKRFFNLPEMIDFTPTDYFFGRMDEQTGQCVILQPQIGKTKMRINDYNIQNGDTLEVVPDPIAG